METWSLTLAWLLARWREARGLSHRLWWLRGHVLRLALSITAATVTFVWLSVPGGNLWAYLQTPGNWGLVFESIAVSTLVLGGLGFWVRLRVAYVFERLPALGADDVKLRPGEALIPFRDQVLWHVPAVNRLLDGASNPIAYVRRPVPLHPLVDALLPLFIWKLPETGWDTSDDAKLRLGSDLSPALLNGGHDVELQASSYFRDRLSNTLANYRVRLDNRELLNLRREVLEGDGSLMRLKESRLANQLGASTMLVTADATLVYLRQGNRVAENQGRLAPAGSGSFDRPGRRALAGMSFQDLARQQARRELVEECGLRDADIVALRLCGFGRYLYRNGKPEVFCLARTRLRASEIAVPVREWDFQQREVEKQAFDLPVDADTVIAALDALRLKLEGRGEGFEQVSGPLYWAVVLAREDLAQLDAAGRAAFFGPAPG